MIQYCRCVSRVNAHSMKSLRHSFRIDASSISVSSSHILAIRSKMLELLEAICQAIVRKQVLTDEFVSPLLEKKKKAQSRPLSLNVFTNCPQRAVLPEPALAATQISCGC